MAVSIRQSTAGDIPLIHDFIVEMFHSAYSSIEAVKVHDLFSPELFYNDRNKRYFKEVFTNDTTYDCIIALEDNQIIGIVAAEKLTPSEVEFHSFYVLPSYSGRGVGSELWKSLDNTYPAAATRYLEVFEQNPNARAIYEHWGYEPLPGYTYPFRWVEWPEGITLNMVRYVKQGV